MSTIVENYIGPSIVKKLKLAKVQLEKQQKKMTTTQIIAALIEARETNFAEVVIESLELFMGKTSMLATIYNLKSEESLRDPHIFSENLKALFGEDGGELILKHILKSLVAAWEKP